MKTLKQHITEGILDIDMDVDVELIEPVKLGNPELDRNYEMNIAHINKDVYIPLANQKLEEFIKAAKDLHEYCKGHNMQASPSLWNAVKDAAKLGLFAQQHSMEEISAARELNGVLGKAMSDTKFKKFIQSKQVFDISLNFRKNYAYLGIWWESDYEGIDDIIKKLESINRSVEVKYNTNSDGESWIQLNIALK